jgi:hypothetical protein
MKDDDTSHPPMIHMLTHISPKYDFIFSFWLFLAFFSFLEVLEKIRQKRRVFYTGFPILFRVSACSE